MTRFPHPPKCPAAFTSFAETLAIWTAGDPKVDIDGEPRVNMANPCEQAPVKSPPSQVRNFDLEIVLAVFGRPHDRMDPSPRIGYLEASMGSDSDTVRSLLRAPGAKPNPATSPAFAVFRSGRRLELRQGRLDELEVTSPDGRVELHVRFTPEGPVLSFEGARIDLSNASELNLRADRVRVRARERIDLSSEDEVVVRGRGNVSIDGENVMLNCDETPVSD